MNFLSKLFKKEKNESSLNLEKTTDGQWMVTKKFKILYMGTKEKCELFIKNRVNNQNGWQQANV